MDIIIKLLHTLFFGAIFYIVFMKYNWKFSIKFPIIFLLIINLIILLYLDANYSVIPNKLLFLLLLFSFSIIVLNVIKGFISMEDSRVLRSNDNLRRDYKNIKLIIFEKVIPIMIFLYQLLLIWSPAIFEKMSQRH